MSKKIAIIDLGTNTFQLIIAEKENNQLRVLTKQSLASRIGQGGIEEGYITAAAIQRAVDVLSSYKVVIDSYEITSDCIFAFGTSAIRNAANKLDFSNAILKATGIQITIIDGHTEASYIYEGVKQAVTLGTSTNLIMDIGGGSVEFIIGNDSQVFWQQSFEIGGQRLMDKFIKSDPISLSEQRKITSYLETELIPLANAIHQYQPTVLVGSSGTFDTLVDMDFLARTENLPSKEQAGFELPLPTFYHFAEKLLFSNRSERMLIPGMIELRVDMIQVAIILIIYILRTYNIPAIKVSKYSLKEGVLATI